MSAQDLQPKIYTGEFRHGIDPKHRVTIPSAWRSGEGDEFYLRIDSTGACISVMPAMEFRAKVALIDTAPGLSLPDRKLLRRQFAAKAQPCTADKQGRMVIPQDFAASIGVKEEAMLVGAYGSFEIWNPEKWVEAQSADTPVYDNLAGQLGL